MQTYDKEISECVFPNLWVRTAVNHNKNPPRFFMRSEKKEQNSATIVRILVLFAPLLIFVWPLEFHIWNVVSGSHKQPDYGQSSGAVYRTTLGVAQASVH